MDPFGIWPERRIGLCDCLSPETITLAYVIGNSPDLFFSFFLRLNIWSNRCLIGRKQNKLSMILFVRERKQCERCREKYNKLEDLIQHMKNVHHQAVLKCRNCGMEFLHEKERLHHVREENERKADARRHR